MRKYNILIFIPLIILISVIYWGLIGFTVLKDISKKEEFKKCVSILSSKIEQIKYHDIQRNDDSAIVSYQNLYDVQNYRLKLSFDIPRKFIFGKMEMNALTITDTLNKIYLNFSSDMKVNSVILNDNTVNFERVNDYIVIDSKGKLRSGDLFNAEISYEGSPKNSGFDSFGFKSFNNEPAIYTLSEPDKAPTWWPCKDIISDKSGSELIITVPSPLTAVSNGLLEKVVDEDNGDKTFFWKSNYPISTYLVSIAIGKYDKWTETYTSLDSSKQMPVEYYTYPDYTENAKIDWKNTVEMIEFFSKTYGEYPFIKEKYGMALFGWVGGAMEHQTISSMGYTLITGTGRFENVVVHELAHQWFGDAVTPATWKDIWLNEGFASYSEALWVENQKGKEAYQKYLKKLDNGYFQGTVYDPEGFIFGTTVYNKGAWCLHMLRGVVGDKVFFEILRKYYKKYEFKNANTYDFKKVCEEVSGTDLTYFFEQWIFAGKGRPEYTYSWKAEDFQDQSGTGIYTVRLNLRQTQKDSELFKMPVKVTVKTDSEVSEISFFNDSKNQQFEFPVKGKPSEILIDNDNWILKKIQTEEYKDTY